ncbi:phosphopantetheine-binding protein [Streptomyces sp. NBC_00162]|uniref:phosphopantetheine-binding protein n=1 Tax=Streptomyces sp. NBC_00162 TaxID=2903629 RepID=UPI00214CD70C|nr:phosphopantetheine-binding protein [Streptomyces sp. NBC_00162]UUU44984.1 phosphopantetheine-binding protein [Streptomyces sp. NBC_00162]
MTNDHPADVLNDLVGVLGDVLRIKAEKIDPEQTFRTLGLDSLLVVEFVAVVNSRYGLRVRATDLYDYPTPASFAREVKRAMKSGEARPAATVLAGPGADTVPGADTAPAAPVPSVASPASAVDRVPAPEPAREPAGAPAAQQIAEVLREQLAAILCCDAWDIDTTAPFNVLGVDSIVGAEFIAVVNRTFGMKERSVLLYEHPNIAAMAAYIAVRTGAFGHEAAPVRAPELASRPAARDDLDVLLDAVREDRLSVDEALVLLARRG